MSLDWLWIVVLMGAPPPSADDLEILIRKHQSQLDAIRTLDLAVRADRSDDGGRSWRLEGTVLWRRDQQRHRFISTRHGGASAFGEIGRAASHDCDIDGEESREIVKPVPPLSGSLRPENNYGHVRARITGPRTAIGIEGAPLWLFFMVDGSHTLMQLFERAPQKHLEGTVSYDGVELQRIRLEDESGRIYFLYLDPARNYALVRREVQARDASDIEWVNRVVESKEVIPGIHIPTRVEIRSKNEPTILDVRVTSVTVNEPLPVDAFNFDFPAGARVRNDETGERYIWGVGKPALTFADAESFREWERVQMGYGLSQSVTKFVLINVAFLLLIALVFVVRRRFARRQSSAGLRHTGA
jgi:hypothetical protein